jgi:hypothetical protein
MNPERFRAYADKSTIYALKFLNSSGSRAAIRRPSPLKFLAAACPLEDEVANPGNF